MQHPSDQGAVTHTFEDCDRFVAAFEELAYDLTT